MPEARDRQPRNRQPGDRRAADRDADLAGIDALIDRLVPALTAKLASTHLGELEIRDGEWRIRLRRPLGAGAWNGELRRSSDRASRGATGHDGHGHGRTAPTDAHRVPAPGGSNGTGHSSPAGGGTSSQPPRPAHEDDTSRVATSPAVGVFRPGARAAVGTRIREGDTLGHVDVLGVQQEVPAPADGMVAELLTEAGTAVEYGQELIVIALTAPVEVGR